MPSTVLPDGDQLHLHTLIIDNFDSYTFNLFQYASQSTTGSVIVVRNTLSKDRLDAILPYFHNVILSPGPGRPQEASDFGIGAVVLRETELAHSLKIPVLGVCLGHQGMAIEFGGTVVHGPEPMHGRVSLLTHSDSNGLFSGIPSPFEAVRYHSLIAKDLPSSVDILAQTQDGVVMALKHRERPCWGVQFHPESVCTPAGPQIIRNFNRLSLEHMEDVGAKTSLSTLPDWITRMCVVPKSIPRPPSTICYKNIIKKLDFWRNAEHIFASLYEHAKAAFWLDSAKEIPGRGEFSFMGDMKGPLGSVNWTRLDRHGSETESDLLIPASSNFFDFIWQRLAPYQTDEKEMHLIGCDTVPFDFLGGLVGQIGYELKTDVFTDESFQFSTASKTHGHPDSTFLFSDRLIAFDHFKKQIYLVGLVEKSLDGEPDWILETETQLRSMESVLSPKNNDSKHVKETGNIALMHGREEYVQNINKSLDFIRDGESYELCLTTQLSGAVDSASVSPFNFYRKLRHKNPAPYAGYLKTPSHFLACSSPELFMHLESTRDIYMKPIKGTLKREPFDVALMNYNQWKQRDEDSKRRLENNEKDRAENLMIVDLIRNDLNLISEPGSVHVPSLMNVESYATVHQLVSTVKGRLKENLNPVEAVKNCFPPGSMTGAPKLRSIHLLESLEKHPRGAYSGCLGYFSVTGACQFNVIIRSACFLPNGQVYLGAGGAIVSISNPVEEFDEMLLKSESVMGSLRDVYGV